VGCIQHEQY
jgi:dihydrofolate reductase